MRPLLSRKRDKSYKKILKKFLDKKIFKECLYEKFVKNRNNLNESEYKNYKKLFASVKQRAKKLHYSNLITNIKTT